jgi:hypothetical protein
MEGGRHNREGKSKIDETLNHNDFRNGSGFDVWNKDTAVIAKAK